MNRVVTLPAPDVTTPSPIHRGIATRVLRSFILLYQHLFSWRVSPCRFVPTCSSYALDAVEIHGAARGSWLAIRRIGRCHPWGGHGHDPVPPLRKPPR
jgi:hypothetical protein